ncbi:Regulator of protease activity HflC (Stomatin/prohibitin superfamily) [Paraburkholderia unamae]|uniref:protease modulator HflK n=1 Tax=Paraburkholderia unamae TaxID=219649 RepID=UPI001CAD95D0|nr:protease modulator HflK [Paraburkholderia unamae]CAG9256733.1 Regulator of protease activity HflC (Stomatin/prohibitin superfamily) [Paraburkholderia unamae]
MMHRVSRERREADGWLSGRAGEARLGWVALALGVVLGVLALVPDLPLDARACAVLSSACLNLFIAVFGTRLPASCAPRGEPATRTLLHVARLALRRDSQVAEMRGLLLSLPWQGWVAPLAALVSFALNVYAWMRPAYALPVAQRGAAPLLVAGAGALLIAFAALVAERFHAQRVEESHAAATLAGLLRVVLAAALSMTACAAALAYTGESLTWLVRALAVLAGAIALELGARAAFATLAPPAEAWRPRSAIACALRWQPHPLAALNAQLRMRYGIDLRQNWALQSVVRLLPAALVAMVAAGWLLGGVAILGPDQRAVYERFGAPVAVWQPGLHVGLPWPFGRARVIDNGAIRQLIVSGSANDNSRAAPPVSADGETPSQLNRLWDVQHPWETTQVIAGTSGEQQAFQIVSADVRLDYRVGLSDAAARASLYRAVDMDATVRSIANREVVRYLASRTLQALLDTPQTAMAGELRAAVQHELDRLASGVEVVAVVIESVHPPAGAAAAYHGVQAAQIRAQASVVQARGFAAAALGQARQQAIGTVAQGSANAADTLAAARVQQIGFDADVIAQQLGGPAFGFEYYLHSLQKGLKDASVTVIDDRLASGNRATIDLRALSPVTAAGVKQAW